LINAHLRRCPALRHAHVRHCTLRCLSLDCLASGHFLTDGLLSEFLRSKFSLELLASDTTKNKTVASACLCNTFH